MRANPLYLSLLHHFPTYQMSTSVTVPTLQTSSRSALSWIEFTVRTVLDRCLLLPCQICITVHPMPSRFVLSEALPSACDHRHTCGGVNSILTSRMYVSPWPVSCQTAILYPMFSGWGLRLRPLSGRYAFASCSEMTSYHPAFARASGLGLHWHPFQAVV